MNNSCFLAAFIAFIIGGAIGAGITYQQVKCNTTGVNIQLKSSGSEPSLSITKTGKDKD